METLKMTARMMRAAQQGPQQARTKFKIEISIKSFVYSAHDI